MNIIDNCEDFIHFNPFECGDLLDEHIDSKLDSAAINKKIKSAYEVLNQLGGQLSGCLKSEIEELSKPILRWQDFITLTKNHCMMINQRNNWIKPKRKLLFSGLYVPTKLNTHVNFLLAYDCSASMTKKQTTYGISQIQALNKHGEGYLLPFDAKPFFDEMIKINSATFDNIKNAKLAGGGGTKLLPVLTQYEKVIGKVDIIVIISDFFLSDMDKVLNWQPPLNTHLVWLSINGNSNFKPHYGRLFPLINN